VFDATPGEREDLTRRVATLAPVKIAVSHEWTGLRVADGLPTSDAARGYYHAMRFVRLAALAARHDTRPMWMIDADTMFHRAPSLLFDLLAGHDLALLLAPGRVEIQNQMFAGVFGVAPTLAAHAYLRRVAAYLFTCWKQGRMPWGLDQTALFCVHTILAAQQAAPEIKGIDESVLGLDFRDDAILWCGKCTPEKPAYATYRAAVDRFPLFGATS
jgi:hypothetical protein